MRNYLQWGLNICFLLTLLYLLFFNNPSTRIAYVDSSKLMTEYLGTKQAVSNYQIKTSSLQANIDTLKAELDSFIASYENEKSSISKEEQQKREVEINSRQSRLTDYQNAIVKKLREEDKQITSAVTGEINVFVKKYAEENNYKLILGATHLGNIVYAQEAIDITDDILSEMNEDYKNRN